MVSGCLTQGHVFDFRRRPGDDLFEVAAKTGLSSLLLPRRICALRETSSRGPSKRVRVANVGCPDFYIARAHAQASAAPRSGSGWVHRGCLVAVEGCARTEALVHAFRGGDVPADEMTTLAVSPGAPGGRPSSRYGSYQPRAARRQDHQAGDARRAPTYGAG